MNCSTCKGTCPCPASCAEVTQRSYRPDYGISGPFRRRPKARGWLAYLVVVIAAALAAGAFITR